MTVPHHDGKHDAEAVITPERHASYFTEQGLALEDVPESVVVTFQRSLFEDVVETRGGEQLAGGPMLYSLYSLADDPNVGVVGDFGIGAPIAAMVAEELIEAGVERLLAVGLAGSLDPEVGTGEPVVCTRALRDEGVSHHYLDAGRWIAATEEMVARCERSVREAGRPAREGPTWTTSAPYRETTPEIERYASEGVLTVEMEAAALFAVAAFRDVEAGAMFAVSDHLEPDGWEPKFHATQEDLLALFDLGRDALG